jgi:pyruvate kinase
MRSPPGRWPSPDRRRHARVRRLVRRLEALHRSLLDAEARVQLGGFGASRESARNLVHYLALRRFDLRQVQGELADLGLSSLGRAEGHVLHNLETVLEALYALESAAAPPRRTSTPIDPEQARARIDRNAVRLFGPTPLGRDTRIMVTSPIEVAGDPRFVRDLLSSGMDCLRINCAHDTPPDWEAMVRQVRRAERSVRRSCRVEMDLGGPRLRTGPIEVGPAVLKLRPERDTVGRVVRPAELHLVSARSRSRNPPPAPEVVVREAWLGRRHAGDRVRFRDARGAAREILLVSATGGGWTATLSKTAYVSDGTSLEAPPRGGRRDRTLVHGIPPRAGRIRLSVGSSIRLVRSPAPGHDRRRGPVGSGSPATVGVTIPEVLGRVRPGERVWFDGGKVGGVVRSSSPSGALVRIEHAPSGGAWLRADQGVNLPDTDLGLPSLGRDDLANLPFIVEHADLIGYSFVQSGEDVLRLRAELRRLGRGDMGIVLKVETRRAFERLPEILLAALRTGPAAVMVARGDLAVEVGFERLAEVQEEVLWLSEAAHLPVIWATQVLEGLAKSGVPSRAEVTDAAMGERAECVMLNKGPYLVSAVRALDSIVRRMQAHQAKKSARLRHLAVAERFLRTVTRGEPTGDGRTRPRRASP